MCKLGCGGSIDRVCVRHKQMRVAHTTHTFAVVPEFCSTSSVQIFSSLSCQCSSRQHTINPYQVINRTTWMTI